MAGRNQDSPWAIWMKITSMCSLIVSKKNQSPQLMVSNLLYLLCGEAGSAGSYADGQQQTQTDDCRNKRDDYNRRCPPVQREATSAIVP